MSADDAAAPTAILLVEDEFLVRLFAIDALEDAGFRVFPDQLVAEVQALRAGLPIVIASGRSGRELRERFSQHSRVTILVKPYTAQLLLEALAEVGVVPATV